MNFKKLKRRYFDDDFDDPFSDSPELPEGTIISNGKQIKLNEVQLQALEAGRNFLADQEKRFFCLSGSAGTGKTTMAKAILQNSRSVIVTAPTHKAKKVVSRATGYVGETIQKILGLMPNVMLEGFSSENVLFDTSGKSLLQDYKIVLIDESSMLSKDLVSLLKSKAIENNIKVFFMGDRRQLPPVGEKVSQVFVDKDIEQFMLTKVERQQEGNPLIGMYSKILDRIDFVDRNKGYDIDDLPYDLISNMNEDGEGYKFVNNNKDFGAICVPGFKLGEDLNNRIIAYTNQAVMGYNRAIRGKLIGDSTLPLQPGELLMAYQSMKDPNDWRHLLYENSADYIVRSVTPGYKLAATYEDTKIKKFSSIDGYFITIEDVDSDRGLEKVFIVKESSYQEYIRIEREYNNFAETSKNNKRWAWKTYYDFRNQFAVFADIKKYYPERVRSKIKVDFDFGYAITVHKSQGSTYNNIFVVANDIEINQNASEKWRLEYVALSRCSKGAYILNTNYNV